MQCGCTDATSEANALADFHLCAERGCLQPHSLENHHKKGASGQRVSQQRIGVASVVVESCR